MFKSDIIERGSHLKLIWTELSNSTYLLREDLNFKRTSLPVKILDKE